MSAPDIREANAEVNADTRTPNESPAGPTPSADIGPPPPTPSSSVDEPQAAKRRVREERFRRVKELTAEGLSVREIARRLQMSVKTVLRYRRAETCPDWQPGRTARTGVDGFAPFIRAWVAAGNRNSADLYRALKGKGFTGGYNVARRYLNRLIGSSGRRGPRDAATRPPLPKSPSARRLSFRVCNPKAESHAMRVLEHLRQRNAALHASLDVAEELMAMLRKTSATTLTDWLAKAVATGDRDLANLAASLSSDAAAVQAAMTEAWSNGPVEGQVGRLKGVKRQMFGRAGMKLLRARVRHKG